MKKNGTKKSMGAKSIVRELVPRANRQVNSVSYSQEYINLRILGGMRHASKPFAILLDGAGES